MSSTTLFRLPPLLFLFAVPLLSSSCLGSKMSTALAQHRKTISELAISKVPPAKKLDIVAETYVQVLEEALRYTSIKKAAKHVDKFDQQNKKELELIFKEIGTWRDNLSVGEQLLFAGKIASRAYTRKLIQLIPKFTRKVNRRIKTFAFLYRLADTFGLEQLLE